MGGTPVISRGSLSDRGVVSRVAEFSPNLIFVAGWLDWQQNPGSSKTRGDYNRTEVAPLV